MSAEFLEKLALALVGPTFALLLAAIIGQRLSAWWSERQKRRELELALANDFYAYYGEFFAIWKEWNWSLKEERQETVEWKKYRSTLYARACKAEGSFEAALLKISAERTLNHEQIEDLGLARQGYQELRESIGLNIAISYGSSNDDRYLAFKRLSTLIGNMLVSRSQAIPDASQAYRNFREITDNRHEGRW